MNNVMNWLKRGAKDDNRDVNQWGRRNSWNVRLQVTWEEIWLPDWLQKLYILAPVGAGSAASQGRPNAATILQCGNAALC